MSRSILKIFLFTTMLLVTVVTASAAVPNDQATDNIVGAIHTYLTPDLSLKSVFTAAATPQESNLVFGKTCKCSCGFPCKTNADCGPGGLCTAGISCCAKTPEAQWFQDSGQSSRKTELPAFKASCN